jgi:hypothetical protein
MGGPFPQQALLESRYPHCKSCRYLHLRLLVFLRRTSPAQFRCPRPLVYPTPLVSNHVSTPDPDPLAVEMPAPATIELRIGGELRQVAYEQAFVAACSLLDHGQHEAASAIFKRLEAFTDRGPRAFIMHAFCESAAKNYDACQAALDEAFKDRPEGIVSQLQDAFVSYHVGIKAEGRQALAELVDQQQHLPTLCLIMGNMLKASGDLTLARRCWTFAIERDRPQGAVAAAAESKLRHTAL